MRPLYVALACVCALCSGALAQIQSAAIGAGLNGTVTSAQRAALSRLQSSGANVSIAWNEANATPAYLAGRLAVPGYRNTFASPREAAIGYISENRILFRLTDPVSELNPLKVEHDNLGMTHVRLQQMFKGLRVVGAQMIVHFAADGSVSSVNGRYSPTPQIETTPGISAHLASSSASQAVKVPAASQELVVYLKNYIPVLAFEVRLPTRMAPNQKVTVDARTGAVLDIDDGIRYDGSDVGSGPGVFGASRSLNIFLSATRYYLVDATKTMYTPPFDSLKGVIDTWDAHNDTIDVGNYYRQASLVDDPNGDKVFNDNAALAAAVDAHFFTGKVYDYYKSHFNRNSWDDAGGRLRNVVHYRSRYNNAFWNGIIMTYGDGDGVVFASLAGAFDVIVHEITHGVTQATAALEYRGQSGALNESYSDVIACMADSGNWQIGEDVYTPSVGGDALRDLSDPHQGGSGPADRGWQPATMNEYLYTPYTSDYDNGEVHTNSGIPNHAAYYVASSIGHARTEQIYYRTLAYYLTPKSVFIDARLLSLQATADLYGGGGAEYAAVAAGFDNVGITSNLPRTDEIAYDDGSPETSVYETDANWGLVNRLTAPGAGKLMTIEFLYRGDNNANGDGSLVLKVFSDNNGQPGSNVFTSTPMTHSSDLVGSWISGNVASQNIGVSGDFYVGFFYDGVNRPMIGADTVSNGRAWEWDNAQNKWLLMDQHSYFPVSLFIRAIVSTATGVHLVNSETPAKFALSQNYPNPFNPSTTINYELPKALHVTVKVFNTLGQEVATLVDALQEAGYKTVQFDGSHFSNGVYLYRLQAGDFTATKKLLLLK